MGVDASSGTVIGKKDEKERDGPESDNDDDDDGGGGMDKTTELEMSLDRVRNEPNENIHEKQCRSLLEEGKAMTAVTTLNAQNLEVCC